MVSIEKKLVEDRIKVEEIIKNKEAKAWERKYLIADSEREGFNLLIIRGIILNKLISKPNHAVNQLFEEIEIIVPIIKVKIKIKSYGFKNIKKRKILLS